MFLFINCCALTFVVGIRSLSYCDKFLTLWIIISGDKAFEFELTAERFAMICLCVHMCMVSK